MPFSMWREMFSRTTIASSTTKPVAIVSAISERLLRQKPARYMTPNVPTSETGTATLGISVARPSRRNAKTTSITSTTEITSARSTSRSDARMVAVRSIAGMSVIALGIAARSEGRSARHAVDRLDDVRVRLAVDDDEDRRLAVGHAGVAQVLHGVDHVADVGKLHGAPFR